MQKIESHEYITGLFIVETPTKSYDGTFSYATLNCCISYSVKCLDAVIQWLNSGKNKWGCRAVRWEH